MCQAGHPLPIYVPARGAAEVVGSGGFPVGLWPDATYQAEELVVEPGDRLYLYSDGISECMNRKDEQFGDARLIDYLESVRERPVGEILRGLDVLIGEWKGRRLLYDDVSMLALEALGGAGR